MVITMASETVVAVFSTQEHAEAAVADLVAAGVPSSSIKHYARDPAEADTTATGVDNERHGGFWAWLTGQETTHEHHDVYDRSMQSGRTIVTVISDGSNADEIYAVLERHDPVDLDEHASGADATQPARTSTVGAGTSSADLGSTGTGSTGTSSTGIGAGTFGTTATSGVAAADTGAAGFAPRTASATDTTRTGDAEEVLSLSEEALQVGKRQVDLGTTRIRRYVVERPVEEQIKLRDETVSVFRRPASGASTVADAFSDREIVVNESAEEAVVAKTARVVEEVVVQKGVQERVETIHDTVRHEEVEIDGPAGHGLDTGKKTNPSI